MTEVTDLTLENLKSALLTENWTKLNDSDLEDGYTEGYKSKRLNNKLPYTTRCEFSEYETGFVKVCVYSDPSRPKIREAYEFSNNYKAVVYDNKLMVSLK